ncbi:tyrosine recombinase XerC [Promicromonospora thailandica]|uniref:Site-specific recombinase XerD n=1 Tax=Promicromonospora thailandica TaxID=765201 RepID=A0A9X2JWJ1_9MICO|nr:site-specific integrase [Promicromonospora thailandica]MCP2265218.1 Site-specific recombinase XerD [Promicromonospora thailandica]BFF19700.1 site-specific integrase [Promicromonospora thailandica]
MSEQQEDKTRRAKGDHTVYFDKSRGVWIAQADLGFTAKGTRLRPKASGKDEEAALRALRKRIREHEAGLVHGWERVTVSQVVEQWLELGRSNVGEKTREGNEDDYRLYIKPYLGRRRVKDLRPDEVDRWLLSLTPKLATSSLKQVRSVLRRSIERAVKHGLAERNVVDLCPPPKGRTGRPSKSLTLEQASDLLDKTRDHHMHAYIVLSLLLGVRPEEARALRWDRVHLEPANGLAPHVEVWRSVRFGGDTKSPKSRRTLAISGYVGAVLRDHQKAQEEMRRKAGDRWQENGLVFPSRVGTLQDAHNVLRMFRDALRLVPGIDPDDWITYELRHSFVSILSQNGMPVEEISRLMGHSGTAVTELVYRHELRPVLQSGAAIMDAVFPVLNASKEDDDDAA